MKLKMNPNAVAMTAVILIIGLALLLKAHSIKHSAKTLAGMSPPSRLDDMLGQEATLQGLGVPAILTRLSRSKTEMAYKEVLIVERSNKEEVSPTADGIKGETADEIDEDRQILRALQAYTDTNTREPPTTDGALRDIEQRLDEEVRISEAVATEWTETLSPILHGDEPQAVKGVFQQFESWASNRRKRRTESSSDKTSKA
jgi:hypothetical protein